MLGARDTPPGNQAERETPAAVPPGQDGCCSPLTPAVKVSSSCMARYASRIRSICSFLFLAPRLEVFLFLLHLSFPEWSACMVWGRMGIDPSEIFASLSRAETVANEETSPAPVGLVVSNPSPIHWAFLTYPRKLRTQGNQHPSNATTLFSVSCLMVVHHTWTKSANS